MRSRVLRLSAAALLAASALLTLAPHATNYVSSSAVVNAPILEVRAPFDGILSQGSVGFAEQVTAGTLLLQLDAERQDQDALAAVQAEIVAAEAQISALSARIDTVQALEQDLHDRILAYGGSMERYIEVARREARAQLERSEIRLRQLEAELERIRALVSNGAASQVALDTIQADLRMAQAEVDAQSARREALEIEAASLEQGVAIDGSVDGGLYARQRMDEVMLQLAELTALRETERGRLAGLEQQADTIATDFARRTSFQPLVAEAAVVWRAAPAVGSSVAAGDTLMELLDCQHRFLEVSLPGTLFERIRPGDRADVLFKGASDRVQAEVAAVGGAGARFDHSHLASDRPEIRADDIQVLVRLSPADASDPEVAASFCDVGRTAEVRFSRDRLAVLDLMASAADALGGWTWELVPLWTETTALQTEQLDPG